MGGAQVCLATVHLAYKRTNHHSMLHRRSTAWSFPFPFLSDNEESDDEDAEVRSWRNLLGDVDLVSLVFACGTHTLLWRGPVVSLQKLTESQVRVQWVDKPETIMEADADCQVHLGWPIAFVRTPSMCTPVYCCTTLYTQYTHRTHARAFYSGGRPLVPSRRCVRTRN